ncbi:MAG TPA: hypothetical protein VM452_05965 [Caulifigura sp.]|nr:hypothetical protein [Caulifigura sp.]
MFNNALSTRGQTKFRLHPNGDFDQTPFFERDFSPDFANCDVDQGIQAIEKPAMAMIQTMAGRVSLSQVSH